MTVSRMFPFITATWNPLGGQCQHNCYDGRCWARLMANRYSFKKYSGEPRILERHMKRHSLWTKDDFVFACTMVDLFGNWVPSALIQQIITHVASRPARFLFLTKNPSRYAEFTFSDNCTLGATIETDIDDIVAGNAPLRSDRLRAMINLDFPSKMVSIEPIMKFTPQFIRKLVAIQPKFVAIGMDNYHADLPEPQLAITEILIHGLEAYGIKVYRKTLREKAAPEFVRVTCGSRKYPKVAIPKCNT